MKMSSGDYEMPSAERAAKRFLERIKTSNPAAYQVIMRRVASPVLSGMGETKEENGGGLWSQIKSGFTDLAATGINIWRDKEIAEEQRRQLQQQAQAELERERLALEQMQAQREGASIEFDIAEERARIAEIMQNIEFSKYQKFGLLAAGGLVVLLIAGRAMGWFE